MFYIENIKWYISYELVQMKEMENVTSVTFVTFYRSFICSIVLYNRNLSEVRQWKVKKECYFCYLCYFL